MLGLNLLALLFWIWLYKCKCMQVMAIGVSQMSTPEIIGNNYYHIFKTYNMTKFFVFFILDNVDEVLLFM